MGTALGPSTTPYAPIGATQGVWYLDQFTGTDDAKMIAALAAWSASTYGGTIVLPARVLTFSSAIQMPYTAAVEQFLRITGAGAAFNGQWGNPFGGTIVDMTYAGANPAKIDARFLGTLEIDHIFFRDSSGDAVPFIQVTNTTPKIHDNAFQGSKTAAWDQDCVVLGGTTTTVDGSATAAFQGYGGYVRDNYFDKIRRGVYGRTYCNAIPITGNTFSTRCGATSAAAAIELDGGSDNCVGNQVYGNTIEMIGYVYGVKCTASTGNTLGPNGFYDNGAGVVAYYRLDTTAQYNSVVDGHRTDTKPLVSEHATVVGKNDQRTSHQTQESLFAQPVRFHNLTTFDGGAGLGVLFSGGADAIVWQPAAAPSASAVMWKVLRSAAEGTNPGTVVGSLTYQGQLFLGGSLPQVALQDATGTLVGTLKPTGIVAAGSGGASTYDNGSGGSYMTLRNYGVKLLDYLGSLTVTLKVGAGSPEGVLAAPVGSHWFRTDGGAGTCLYVKESGTGNTGWVAK